MGAAFAIMSENRASLKQLKRDGTVAGIILKQRTAISGRHAERVRQRHRQIGTGYEKAFVLDTSGRIFQGRGGNPKFRHSSRGKLVDAL